MSTREKLNSGLRILSIQTLPAYKVVVPGRSLSAACIHKNNLIDTVVCFTYFVTSMNNKAIGIFDSGIGGLTVFKAIRQALPDESLIYLGDTARVPYGTKSSETIVRYSLENSDFLYKRGVKAIVVACNTSSAYAIPAISDQNGVPVIGVIEPGVNAAVKATKNGNIGVIGTASTINSNRYASGLKKRDKKLKVVSLSCPLFVPLVEEGWTEGEITEKIAERYLSTMKMEEIDTLILGCTHYPLLKNVIQKFMGDGITLVDSAEALAHDLSQLLRERYLLRNSDDRSEYHLYVTDLPGRFEVVAQRFLGGDLPPVKRIEL